MKTKIQTSPRRRRPWRPRPTLRFTPYAWAKLLFLRDFGPTEVGGFGLSSLDDVLRVEDVQLIEQRATSMTVEFDDAAVADFFDEQVDQGNSPSNFARIWVHTHPGDCAQPSGTDEETFDRCFGSVDWAVMFILARGGETYARLRFRAGPGGDMRIPMEVDWDRPFSGSDSTGWEREYWDCVHGQEWSHPSHWVDGLDLFDSEARHPGDNSTGPETEVKHA